MEIIAILLSDLLSTSFNMVVNELLRLLNLLLLQLKLLFLAQIGLLFTYISLSFDDRGPQRLLDGLALMILDPDLIKSLNAPLNLFILEIDLSLQLLASLLLPGLSDVQLALAELVLALEAQHVLNHLLLLLDLDALLLVCMRLNLLLSLQVLTLLHTRVVFQKSEHLVEIALLCLMLLG